MFMMFWKPYSLFMMMMLLFGIILSLSAENWLGVWMGMEINLYSFIPLILLGEKNQEKEAAIKYFISQSIPSALLMVSFLGSSLNSLFLSLMILLALVMKMGMAPLHYWLPSVMGAVSWGTCWILSTIQKIVPMMAIFYLSFFSSTMIIYLASLSSVIGGIGGLNQTMLRVLLSYSSIGHMGWILGASLCCNEVAMFYFLSYIFIISAIFLAFDVMKVMSGSFMTKLGVSSSMFMVIMVLFLSLGGLPPFFGFFPKIFVLSSLMNDYYFLLSFFLIMGSVMNLYYYLKMLFIMVLMGPSPMFGLSKSNYMVISMIMSALLVMSMGFMVIFMGVM